MTEPYIIQACPKCDSPRIWFRKTLGDYRCFICKAVFAQPVEREAKWGFMLPTAERCGRYKANEAANIRRRELRAAKWDRKIAKAKAKWHAKFDGDMPGEYPEKQTT